MLPKFGCGKYTQAVERIKSTSGRIQEMQDDERVARLKCYPIDLMPRKSKTKSSSAGVQLVFSRNVV